MKMSDFWGLDDGRPQNEIHRIDTRDCAKLIRQILREAYPEIKFSVRIERYSGGSSVDVKWTDGPTERQVETFCGHCRQDPGYITVLNDEQVLFGATHLDFFRTVSDERIADLTERLAKLPRSIWGIMMSGLSYPYRYNAEQGGEDDKDSAERCAKIMLYYDGQAYVGRTSKTASSVESFYDPKRR